MKAIFRLTPFCAACILFLLVQMFATALPESRAQRREKLVSYSPSSASFSVHEPIVIDFSITNHLGEIVKFDLGPNSTGAFKFKVTQPDGAVLTKMPRMVVEGLSLSGKHSLAPQQTYAQRLILNSWFEISTPGTYQVAVQLESPIKTKGDQLVSYGESQFTLELRPRDVPRLEQVCSHLLAEIEDNKNNYEAAAEAAVALSHATDPVAVPYLARAITANPMIYTVALQGLGRIRNEEAISTLIAYLKSEDNGPDWPIQSRIVLQAVEGQVSDPSLRSKIRDALQEYFLSHSQ